MAKSIKWEVRIVLAGLLLVSTALFLFLSHNDSPDVLYRHSYIDNWKVFSSQVIQFRNTAVDKGISHKKLTDIREQMVKTVRTLQANAHLPLEREMIDQVTPYLAQILEYSGLAIKMYKTKEDESYDKALLKMGFSLEEVAKVITIFN